MFRQLEPETDGSLSYLQDKGRLTFLGKGNQQSRSAPVAKVNFHSADTQKNECIQTLRKRNPGLHEEKPHLKSMLKSYVSSEARLGSMGTDMNRTRVVFSVKRNKV